MPELSTDEKAGLNALGVSLAPAASAALSDGLGVTTTVALSGITGIPVDDLVSSDESVLAAQLSLSTPLVPEALISVTADTAATLAGMLTAGPDGAPVASPGEAEIAALTDLMTEMGRALAEAVSLVLGEPCEVDASSVELGPVSLPPGFALTETAAAITFTIQMEGHQPDEMRALISPAAAFALSNAAIMPPAASTDGEAMHLEQTVEDPDSRPRLMVAGQELPRGIDLILDIPLEATVELGRARLLIKDVLELTSGSIVELDRIAGEPVDLLVNGRLVAKGEVVVIEDNFGIRVTEVVSPADRLAGLGKAS